MKKVLDWIDGKKTFVVGIALIGYALYNHWFGMKLPWEELVAYVFAGAGLVTVRSAINKIITLLKLVIK